MAYSPRPETTRDSADYAVGTTQYTLQVASYTGGADVAVHRERAGTLTAITRQQATLEALSGGGVEIKIEDVSLWQAGDRIVATRSSEADDPSSYTGFGPAGNVAVRASMERVFAIVQELIADTGEAASQGVSLPQVDAAITAAIAAQDPIFTTALKKRLEATLSATEVATAIDAVLDGLPARIRAGVTGSFVVGLIDTATGSATWRTGQAPSISVDPDQMTGDGSSTSPVTIVSDGITLGLIAANAVATRNIGDEQVTIDKLSAVLQANWRNMLLSARSITVSGGTATVTRVDGTTYTFDVGTGMGGSGGVEVFERNAQGAVQSKGSVTEILFREASVTVAGDRATVDPEFPAQRQADWTQTDVRSPAYIRNKPGSFVDTFTTRPTDLTADRLYAYAGAPDRYGGPGLYQAVPNPDTPLNLVAGGFGDSAAQRAAQALQALPTSPSNHWLRGWGTNLSVSSPAVASDYAIWLWLDDDAPAAATLYAQFRTDDGSGTWSSWSAVVAFTADSSALPAGLVAPTGTRQYRGLPGGFPASWPGGYGRTTQIRVWNDRLATQPYDLKLSHTVRWLEDPADALHYLQGLTGDHRMSTHVLKDGALARVVETTPTDLSGYADGELVLDISTNPVSLKVVTSSRDQPVADANRFTVSTDEQGNGVAAQGDFDPNPGTNYFQIHVSPGDGTAAHKGRVTLYLDTPGDTPPASFIGRPVSAGFPVLDDTGSNTKFTRIPGALGSITVGSRRYQGYQADFVDANLHRFGDATFSYDLFTRYASATDNDPLNVNTGTVHIPAALADVGGSGGGVQVPVGGWPLSQVAAENRRAARITVDASGFTGNLSTGDTDVQAALETLDGGAAGRPVRIAAADAATEAGQVPVWTAASKWIASKIGGAADAIGVSDTLGLSLIGKLLEIYNAFSGGSWSNVAGTPANAPAVASVPLAVRPVGVLGTWVFTNYASNVSPAWPQTLGGQTWIVVRTPSDTDFREERFRVAVVESDGTTVVSSFNLDDDAVSLVGSAAGFHYYRVDVSRIGAGEGYRVQQLMPFAPVRSRLDLVTSMLRDFVPTGRSEASSGRVVIWDWATRGFILGRTQVRPRLALRVLHDGAGFGRSIPASATDYYFGSGFDRFDNAQGNAALDFDNADDSVGVIQYEGTLTLSGKSSTGISFATAAQAVDTVEVTGFALASKVKDSTAFSLTARNGVRIAVVPLYNSGALMGEIWVYLAKNANNEAGLYKYWSGSVAGQSFTVSADEDVVFEANDGTSTGGASALVDLTDTPPALGTAGQLLATNAGRTATEWVDRPTGGGGSSTLLGLTDVTPSTYTGQGGKHVAVNTGETGVEFVDAPTGGGGGGSAPMLSSTALATGTANTDLATTAAGVWSHADNAAWKTLLTSPAITSAQAGVITVEAILRGEVVEDPSGGGDRVYVETKIVRVRNSVATAIDWNILYVRNNGQGAAVFNQATQVLEEELACPHEAQAGDVFRVEARIITQANAVRTMRFTAGDTKLLIVSGGGGGATSGGASSFTDLDDTPGALGTAGQVVQVNAARTALEFGTPSAPAPPDASTTVKGIIEIADTTEADTGTADDKAMTPELVQRRLDNLTLGGKGRKIAETTLPIGVQAIGTQVTLTWAIESDFTGDYSQGANTLFAPRCIDHPGWLVEVMVGTEIASCSWITSNALDDGGGRRDSAVNYAQYYKLSCQVQLTTNPASQVRAVNMEFQRQLSQRARDNDAFRIYGAGGQALLANTKIVVYEWVSGKGEKGDPGAEYTEVENEAAYNALAVKDADTVYWWEE